MFKSPHASWQVTTDAAVGAVVHSSWSRARHHGPVEFISFLCQFCLSYSCASRRLDPHVPSLKRVSCDQQSDFFVCAHDQRHATDEMRTPWKLLVDVASKNCVWLTSACPEVLVMSCSFDDLSLFEAIRVFEPCACTWCCNTKTSASSVSLVFCSVFSPCALRLAQVRSKRIIHFQVLHETERPTKVVWREVFLDPLVH